MDKAKALALESELKGKKLNNYTVIKFIDNGKSAAVFEAKGEDGNKYALKVFDSELVERFGHKIQKIRIEQELSLKGHEINNLVRIIDGGATTYNGEILHFMVMEFIEGENLKNYIQSKSYDEKFIKKVISVLFKVTEDLMLVGTGIAHRDIKPENIMIDLKGEIIIMDLGVLKFISTESFSDGNEDKQFVGTLRYAAPEFLFREEEDSVAGWRALNYYQIGGVLHDLIMKKELFHDRTPYANLVLAIKEDNPEIINSVYSTKLIQLARDLLIKKWQNRILSVSKDRISDVIKIGDSNFMPIQLEIQKIFSIRQEHENKKITLDQIRRSEEERKIIRVDFFVKIKDDVKSIIDFLKKEGIIEAIEGGGEFLFPNENSIKDKTVTNIIYKLPKSISLGLPRPLNMIFSIKNDETGFCEIDLAAFYLSPFVTENLNSPLLMFENSGFSNISLPTGILKAIPQNKIRKLEKNKIFVGTYSNNNEFIEILKERVLKVIVKAMEVGKPLIESQIEDQIKIAKGEKTLRIRLNEGANRFIETTFILI